MSDNYLSPKNQSIIKTPIKTSKKVLTNANKHITNLLNSFITKYEQNGGIPITNTIQRRHTIIKRQQFKRQHTKDKDKDKDKTEIITNLIHHEPCPSSGSSTLRSSLHLLEENVNGNNNKTTTENDTETPLKQTALTKRLINNNIIHNTGYTLTKYNLSKKTVTTDIINNNNDSSSSSSSSSSAISHTDSDINNKHEYDSSNSNTSNNSSSVYNSKHTHKPKSSKKNNHHKSSFTPKKVHKLTTMKPLKPNPNISYLKRKQTMIGNNFLELNNINYLTHSNMLKLRNICDEIKYNICNNSSKQIIKNAESKHYVNDEQALIPTDIHSDNELKQTQITQSNYNEDNDVTELSSLSKNKYTEQQCRVLMRKEQVYDSLDDEEIEDEIYDNFYISGNSRFVFVLDIIIYILMLYSVIYTPLELALHIRDVSTIQLTIFFYIEVIIDCVLLFDVVIRFFISYTTFDETEITKHKSIAIHYVFSWFIIDLLSACPFNSLLLHKELIKETQSTQVFYTYKSYVKSLFNFFRLFRLFKSLKLLNANTFSTYIITSISKFNHFQRWSKVYICLVGFIISLHILTSLNIFIGRTSYQGWLSIYLPNNRTQRFYITYIFSLYYILCTLLSIGYGDVLSQSMNERVFNLFLMFFGIMIYSFGISSISTYIMTKDAKTIEFEEKCAVLKEIKISHEKMSDELYEKIYRFLYYRKKHEKKDKNVILDALPIGLKNNLIYEMYKPIIQHFIFFRNFDNVEFIVRVIMCFQVFPCTKGEVLVKEGDYLEEMFFIKNGNLSLQLPLPDVDEAIAKTNHLRRRSINNAKKSSMMLTKPFLRQRASLFALQNRMSYEDIIHEDMVNSSSIKNKNNNVDSNKYNRIFIQILEIRKNEHFGDILMFLNLKSPLTVKVKSKKAELLLFKKTDAVSISVNYPQIWSKIIKKSLFNMEQIERLINRATKLFLDSNKAKLRHVIRHGCFRMMKHGSSSNNNVNMSMKGNNSNGNFGSTIISKGNDVGVGCGCGNGSQQFNKSLLSALRRDSNGKGFSDLYKIANINTSNIELKSIPSLSNSKSYVNGEDGNNNNNNNNNVKDCSSFEIKEVNESDNSSANSSDSDNNNNNNVIKTNNLIDQIPKLKLGDITNNNNNNISNNDSDGTIQDNNTLSNIIFNNNNNARNINSSHSTESIDINCGINNISIHSQNLSLVSYYSTSSRNIHSCRASSFTLPAQYSNILTLYQNELSKAKHIVDTLIQCGNEAYSSIHYTLSQFAFHLNNNNNSCFNSDDDKKSTMSGKLSKSSSKSIFQRANSLNNNNNNKQSNHKRMIMKNFLQQMDTLLKNVSKKKDKKNPKCKKSRSITNKTNHNKQINLLLQGNMNQKRDDKDKDKNGLLSEIRENVEENALNLNNPEMFYAEYFQKIMNKEQQQQIISNNNNSNDNNNDIDNDITITQNKNQQS